MSGTEEALETVLRAGGRISWRRVGDVVLGGLLLVVALPLLAACAALVVAAHGRPAFFGHRRVGRHGRVFRCWKLRTMEPDAEARLRGCPGLSEAYRTNGFKLPAADDPRITRVGRFLRRTYLDELPQLVNVVAGDMSLVGPRPVVSEELELFEPHVQELLRVRPGLVGAWTSLGRERPPYPERVRVELEYLRRRSPATDLRILVRSLGVVLRGQEDP